MWLKLSTPIQLLMSIQMVYCLRVFQYPESADRAAPCHLCCLFYFLSLWLRPSGPIQHKQHSWNYFGLRRTCPFLVHRWHPFIFKNPWKSILVILNSLSLFSALSGYKINLGKSVAMPFNISPNIFIQSPFHVSEEGLKYLGIFITPDLNNLFQSNFPL